MNTKQEQRQPSRKPNYHITTIIIIIIRITRMITIKTIKVVNNGSSNNNGVVPVSMVQQQRQ
jgi:hypothetical protein